MHSNIEEHQLTHRYNPLAKDFFCCCIISLNPTLILRISTTAGAGVPVFPVVVSVGAIVVVIPVVAVVVVVGGEFDGNVAFDKV